MAVLVDSMLRGLDVAVHEPAPVGGVERAGDLGEDASARSGASAPSRRSSVVRSLPSTKRIAR